MPQTPSILVGSNNGLPHVAPHLILGIPNSAGGGAGQSVSVFVSLPPMPPMFPGNGAYMVKVTPAQACFVAVTGKTSSGFTVTLTPSANNITLGASTFDVCVQS
jgi:hypothetical protein